jgi:hypothetical protein
MNLIGENRYRGYSWMSWQHDGYNWYTLLFKQIGRAMWKPVKTLVNADEPSDEWVKGKIDEEIYEGS